MLEIKKISVNNFFSVGSITLPVEKGLHYIIGINNDIESSFKSSNGSGKTATFSSIYQGLFNKNIKNPKGTIESVNNSITGKPYSISLDFTLNEKDNYTVTNDRNTNKITVLKNGVDISVKGIPNQLKQIKDILGLDFDTFSALTYISQSTLQAILDTTNKDNILFQFFNIASIQQSEAILKEERKELKNLRVILITKMRNCEKNISLLSSFQKVNVTVIEENINTLTKSLLAVTRSPKHAGVEATRLKIVGLKEERSALNTELSLINYKIVELERLINSSNICPTCGAVGTLDKDTLNLDLSKLIEEKSTKENFISNLTSTISTLDDECTRVKQSLADDEAAILGKINILKSKLLVVAEQNSAYDKIVKQRDEIEKELSDIVSDMDALDKKLALVEECLLFIKNGTLTNEYLNKFRKVFVTVLKDLIDKTDFTIDIKVSVKNGKLEYEFYDRGILKGFNDLSAGERTRVSLVLLITTLFTLEQVTGISTNYLVIDELFGVLDDEGISMVTKFLEIIRENKAVYVITHHEELPINMFDTVITFTKDKGVTSLTSINSQRGLK
jgi:DNA repair exonuclease SbcCD ATPase subunit